MRHKVVIETVTRTKNATTGNDTETWATWKTVRARILPAGGREYFSGRQVVGEASMVLEMYYQPINVADYRISYADPKNNQTRVLGIRSITTPEEYRGFMVLACDDIDAE